MIKKVLIANRGEIAVRIIRACNEMGIIAVAIYSTADKHALHVEMADEAVCVGGPRAKDSYLNIQNIISAAVATKSQAIHPGFGFLSENTTFANLCEECNIKFIGPSARAINLMGDKSKARETMIKAGVPVVPGSQGVIKTIDECLEEGKRIGYPLMIKASSGGGGKGIRIVEKESELENAYNNAKNEAKASFGNDEIYMEKYIGKPRHIEFQILADKFGNVVHLGERDCSLQRRNQKIIEEAPSIVLSQELREKMGMAATRAAECVKYENAGTIEFLLDKNQEFYFMEMNTRIQVEHPITEAITGIDLIKEQFKIAMGEKLSFKQEDIKIKGHAIECRINAEDPSKGFVPSPGTIEYLYVPGGNGVRVDSAIYQGYTIPPFYDSMVMKLIVYGKDREEAISKMRRSMEELVVDGIETNTDLLLDILYNKDYSKGDFYTKFIEDEIL